MYDLCLDRVVLYALFAIFTTLKSFYIQTTTYAIFTPKPFIVTFFRSRFDLSGRSPDRAGVDL